MNCSQQGIDNGVSEPKTQSRPSTMGNFDNEEDSSNQAENEQTIVEINSM